MEKQTCSQTINNAFYDTLHEKWISAEDHPVALLRAENAVRVPWIINQIRANFSKPIKILDVGCGAGFLTNALAREGHDVSGVDLSEPSLKVAKQNDTTGKVKYRHANAYELPFEDSAFDVVCAMDILEHVEEPQRLISEASRVLKKEGLFFFHTFNRNVVSYFFIIKGVEWFVKNTPQNLHVYHLFIKPKELSHMCRKAELEINCLQGFVPEIWQKPFWKMLGTGIVSNDFRFKYVNSLLTGYSGYCKKL